MRAFAPMSQIATSHNAQIKERKQAHSMDKCNLQL
jgi:hypothetical protein